MAAQIIFATFVAVRAFDKEEKDECKSFE